MYGAEAVSAFDRQSIRAQLGRDRYDPVLIASRCQYGYPRAVLSFFKQRDGREPEVSRTIHWLTCPYLMRRVGELESKGFVGLLEFAIASRLDLKMELAADQSRYRVGATAAFRRFLPKVDSARYLRAAQGIGGVRSPEAIKCLHSHLAYTLATGQGLVGHMVKGLIETRSSLDCPDDECTRLGYGTQGSIARIVPLRRGPRATPDGD